MEIASNSLLTPTTKNLKVYQNCIIANDGPNQIAKLGLTNLNIPYDSVFTSRMTLASKIADRPIMYGYLGTNVTFLVIKPNWAVNPQVCSSGSSYLEYFFEDEPLIRRTLTDLMILSGNDAHRIPQVYLYNPTDATVSIDIMCANLDENEISTTLVPEFTEFTGLAFSDICSDQMYATSITGSTQFEILNYTGQTQVSIPYANIDLISLSSNVLTVTTNSIDPIKLTFVSEFNAQQAYSRMNWVMEGSGTRWLTKTYPGLDTTAPTITFNPVQTPEIMALGTGISKAAIRFRFISSVIDYDNAGLVRDGVISSANVGVLILNSNTAEQLTAITADGSYAATFQARDVAGNATNTTKTILVDSAAPTIYYTTGKTINNMDLTGNTQTPGIINYRDLRIYYIDYVWDSVDGSIANSAVTVTITSGVTMASITGVGYYTIGFSVSDRATNTTVGSAFLHVTKSGYPDIIYNGGIFSGYTNSAFTMIVTTGITAADILAFTVSAVTDSYDGIIPNSSITISGATFPIGDAGSYTITYTVSDSSENTTIDSKYLIVTT